MKRRVSSISCAAVFLAAFIVTGVIESGMAARETQVPAPSVTEKAAAETASLLTEDITEENGYVLKEYKGAVGVFSENDSDVPVAVTGIRVSGLRSVDQEMIRRGIRASSYEDVLQLIEDFNS